MYASNISPYRPICSASVPQQPATPLSDNGRAFVKELVQINNARGVDGIRGREGERVTWFTKNRFSFGTLLVNTELNRQKQRTLKLPTLQACAASACVGTVKDTSDLRRTVQLIDSPEVAPGLRALLKSAAAEAILRVRSKDDKSLAMIIAKERAASGTHLFKLNLDHGQFNKEDYVQLGLAAAEGVLGDLAAEDVHVGCIMYQFGISSILGQFRFNSAKIRDVLQWRAVNGAAGRAVKAGMPLDQAMRRYGLIYGYPSTLALDHMAYAARINDNRRTT